ncbi:response regulator transcription factor [Perlucidibaca piscinae]|uniref:response regulator transcription factor n=1 Tax=Perlucidibaca piscinae TaxID=392589 RepID=UPI0003B62392|nr:response regulator transcription factor [Perlucidibaca piscinae]
MSATLSLALVEDNQVVREEMACFLSLKGFPVHLADCGEQLNELLCSHEIDVVVLDINLPHEDGYSIAKRLRRSHPGLGIIMLTARTRHADRTLGYQAGADVYITKPVQPEELLAVLETMSRRLVPRNEDQLSLCRQHQLLRNGAGASVGLTMSELLLLETLMLSPNKEADAEYLRLMLSRRGDEDMSRDSLYVVISRLKTKISRGLGVSSLLSSIRGYGYRLTVPVRMD